MWWILQESDFHIHSMSYFYRKEIGCATIASIVPKTPTRQVSRRWAKNPVSQGPGWMDIEECGGTCSSEHTSIRRPVAPKSY